MTADVFELMTRAEELPYGEAKTVLVEDALRRAEASGDADLAFRVRMSLTTAYQYGGEPAKAFTTFSRCLAEFDRDPARADTEHRLLWQMKWIVNSLTLFPEIPLDRTRAVLDDMERRYRLGGHSLQAVYHYRHAVAQHVGDVEAADELFAKWRAAERDALSDCEGCDPSSMAHHLAERGRWEDALAVAAPVLNAELNCSEQPQDMLTTLLRVYLHTGRHAEARDAHRRAYRLHRPNLADLSNIADHLWFCAVTGNEARGLEILQRHLGWLDRAPSPFAAMRFAASGGLLLRRLGEIGAAGIGADGLTVRRPASGDRPAGDVALPVLRDELERLALDIATRFDARNGSSYQSDEIRELLAAEPLVERLPLTEHARAAAAGPRPDAIVPLPRPSAGPDIAAADDPDELLDLAERLWREHDTPAALAAYARFDEVTGAEAGTPPADGATPADWLRAARRLDGHGVGLTESGSLQDAYDVWERARAWFEQADEPARALSVSSRLGAILATLGRRDEARVLLTEAVDGLVALDADQDRVRGCRMRLAQFHMMGDDPRNALAALAGLDGPDGDVAFLRGQAHGMLGHHDEAETALRAAREAFRESGQRDELAQAAMLYTQVMSHAPERDELEVSAALDEAVAHAPAAVRAPMLRPFAHWERGRFLLAGERADDAVPDLVEAVAAFTALGRTAEADHARVDLAAAYLGAHRPLEAAETVEEALATLPDGSDELPRARAVLANAQRDLGEPAAADTFAEIAAGADEPGVAGHFLQESAGVLTDFDRDAQAAERFLAAAEAFAQAGDPYREVDCRRRGALCHLWAQQADESLAAMAATRAALSGLPGDNPAATVWHTALVDYDEARILARIDRLPEALARAEAAIEGFTALDETDARDTVLALRADITAALNPDPADS